MTEVLDNVEHLEKKIQKLVSYHHSLRESNNRLADENKKLIARLEQQETERSKHDAKSKHNNTDIKNLKIKVEEIIRELDNSLNILSNKSESTL
jgi:seryl-tRNA synthetase